MIKFYFVRGISKFDTPYFWNTSSQELYFKNKQVGEMYDSFYPPHFMNKIDVSDEELDFKSQINYLSIDFQDKTYYYFINEIEYITENLIRLTIEMDVIQTYYFNIFVNYIDIDKRLINRWKDDKSINRNYIRENLSEGIFELTEYKNFTQEHRDLGFGGYIVAKTNRETIIGDFAQQSILDMQIGEELYRQYNDDTFINLIPAGDINTQPSGTYPINVVYKYISNGDEHTYNTKTLFRAIHVLAEKPEIVSMFYIPQNPFVTTQLVEQVASGYYNILSNSSQIDIPGGVGNYGTKIDKGIAYATFKDSGYGCLAVYSATLDRHIEKYDFKFEQNNQKNIGWDCKYIPQLLDENYIQILYGERSKYTTYPISLIEYNYSDLQLYYVIDVFTGARIYWIGDEEDKYLTKILCDTSQNVTMWNDYWQNYQATHKGTMSIRPLYETGKFAVQMMRATKSKGFYTPKRQQVSVKGKRLLNENYENYLDYAVNTAENQLNLIYTPETLKQVGDYTTNVISNQLDRIYEIFKVKDYEDVGRLLEGYGYKVHEHYSNISNIFDIINTRYYYNIVRASNVSVSLNILSSNDILSNIEDRFLTGLRLWNIDNGELLDTLYKYDNVEKDYL